MRGVDVNDGRGAIDWRRVRAAGYEFAFIKATEGRTWDDSRYRFNRQAAKAAGLTVGAYHYARPDNNTPQQEVEHFLAVHRPQPGELLPALDFEVEPPSATWALDFLRRLETAIGARPILYTYADFLNRMGSFDALSRYPLWYAHYGANDGTEHTASPPSQFRFAVHQFTSRGRVPGIPGTTANPFADVNVLKLTSLEPLLFKPGGPEPWRGKFDMYAGGRLVSVGNIRSPQLTVTEEARTWIEAARAAGGVGRIAPHREEEVEQPPHEPQPPPESEIEPPPHAEGEGFAGRWSEDSDLERLQREFDE